MGLVIGVQDISAVLQPMITAIHHAVTPDGLRKEQNKLRSRAIQLETVAYHEAGHALCAWHFEIPFGKKALSIVPNDSSKGRFQLKDILKGTRFDVDDSDRARMKMEKLVLVSLAGIQAQRRYRSSSIRSWHAQADYHSAINILSYFAPNPAELAAYFKLLRIRVDLLFNVPYKWAQVEALAASEFANPAWPTLTI